MEITKFKDQIFDQYFAPPLPIRRLLLCMSTCRRCAIIKHQQKKTNQKKLKERAFVVRASVAYSGNEFRCVTNKQAFLALWRFSLLQSMTLLMLVTKRIITWYYIRPEKARRKENYMYNVHRLIGFQNSMPIVIKCWGLTVAKQYTTSNCRFILSFSYCYYLNIHSKWSYLAANNCDVRMK